MSTTFIRFLQESAEQHEKFKDHTKNPFYKVIQKYGLKHVKTELTRNKFAPTSLGDKADITVHKYVGPNDDVTSEKPEIRITVEQDHVRGQGGHVYSDDKGYDWAGGYRQDNGIWAPAHGSTKPGLDKFLKSAGLKPLNESIEDDEDYDEDDDYDEEKEDAILHLTDELTQQLMRKELHFEDGTRFFPEHKEGKDHLRGRYENHPEFGDIDSDLHELNDIVEKLIDDKLKVYNHGHDVTERLSALASEIAELQDED